MSRELAGKGSSERRRKLRRSAKARLDREARKDVALQEGTEVEFGTCPLCGRNQPLKSFKLQVKPDYAIVTVRKGGGRRRGFFLLLDRNVYLKDLPEKYPEVWKNLKQNVEELHDLTRAVG
jgi:hypothetical protein